MDELKILTLINLSRTDIKWLIKNLIDYVPKEKLEIALRIPKQIESQLDEVWKEFERK